MKTCLSTVALAITLTGCATPNLQGVLPLETEVQQARNAITYRSVPPPRNLRSEQLQSTLDRVVERIRTPAYEACQAMQAQDCQLALNPITLVDDDEINAYVDVENRVSVHTGLVRRAANDEEIAAVLAHEYGHIFAGHIGKSGRNTSVGMLIGAAIGLVAASQGYDPNGDLTASLLETGYNAGSLAYSPEFELEADYYAALILDKAEIDLGHGRDVLLRLAKTSQGRDATGSWGQRAQLMATTHPADDWRIARWMGVSQSIENSRVASPTMDEEALVAIAVSDILNEPLFPNKVSRWVNPENGRSGMTILSHVNRQPECDQVCVVYSNTIYTQDDSQGGVHEVCKFGDGEWNDPISFGQSWKVLFGGCLNPEMTSSD